jgi:hypothetical protein
MRLMLAACTGFCAIACTDSGGGRGAADVPDGRIPDARVPVDSAPVDMQSDGPDWPDFRRPPADAGADLGTGGEFPPYLGRLPMGRETMLRWIRARVRTVACVDLVLDERGIQDFHSSFDVWRVQEINFPGRRGRLSVFRREIECDAAAETCLGYLACVGATLEPQCRPANFDLRLLNACAEDGSTLMECLDPIPVALPFDCAELGGQCGQGDFLDAECVYGDCATPDRRCLDDDTLEVCTEHGHLALDECQLAATCGDALGLFLGSCFRFPRNRCSDGQCTGSGPECDHRAPPTCVDEFTVEACQPYGRLGRLHCPDYWEGSRCVPDTGESEGAACSPTNLNCGDFHPTCSDGGFDVCVGGSLERIDCGALGMMCRTTRSSDEEMLPGCYFPR